MKRNKKERLEDLSDEELLNLYRDGETKARDILSVRYFQMKNALLARFDLEHRCFRDEWELNEAYFLAYLKTEATYVFDKKTKFLSLMCRNITNELVRVYNEDKKRLGTAVVNSFEDRYADDMEEEEDRTFGDVLSADSDNDSKDYIDFASTLNFIDEKLSKADKKTKRFIYALFQGYGFSDACVVAKIGVGEGRTMLRKIKEILQEREYVLENEVSINETAIFDYGFKELSELLKRRRKREEKHKKLNAKNMEPRFPRAMAEMIQQEKQIELLQKKKELAASSARKKEKKKKTRGRKKKIK